ncbi:MAG: hypothetical protein LEGION0398_MBIBDBAK_01098 [Legionellaceae bacterium]
MSSICEFRKNSNELITFENLKSFLITYLEKSIELLEKINRLFEIKEELKKAKLSIKKKLKKEAQTLHVQIQQVIQNYNLLNLDTEDNIFDEFSEILNAQLEVITNVSPLVDELLKNLNILDESENGLNEVSNEFINSNIAICNKLIETGELLSQFNNVLVNALSESDKKQPLSKNFSKRH